MKEPPIEEPSSNNEPVDESRTLQESFEEFQQRNPEIQEALRLFNISWKHYQATSTALTTAKTYVTTSTLLPGRRG